MFLTENPPGLNAPKIHQSICLFQKHQYMLIYKCIHEQIQIQIWHMKVDKDSKFACTVNTNIYSECGHQSFFMCIYDETETRTEEIGLEKYLRLPKFPTSFHGSPHAYQIRYHGSPQHFKQIFTWLSGVPVTQKTYSEIG